MEKIGYVSNLPLSESSGGWTGINRNLFEGLSNHLNLKYIGPINPDFILREKMVSKLKRTIGFKSDFAFFSKNRLKKISQEFKNLDSCEKDAYFFFGNTPWISIDLKKPYYVYMDADFETYLKIFSDESKFSKKSIHRVVQKESQWLEKADKIFFGSNWIMKETISNLKLSEKPGKYHVVNTGGHIPIPGKDSYVFDPNHLNLLFVALNFEKKGGLQAVDIFKELKKTFNTVKLTIIGEQPPERVLDLSGVQYLGRLNKDIKNELAVMENAFQNASFLIHPTKMDTMGAIIPEANYFGTPVVASDKFGIPDLIQDERTGFLIKEDESIEEISRKISKVYSDRQKYMEMRNRARHFSIENYSWDAIVSKIAKSI